MNEAIIFDFDGTIADSLPVAVSVYNDLAQEMDLKQIEATDLPTLQHFNLPKFLDHIEVKKRHIPLLLARGRTMFKERMDSLSPCPGVAEILPNLRAHTRHFGILTSNSVENVELFLRQHGLREHFDFISSCPKLKGKAKYLRGIARTFSLHPHEMIYVGDEVRDIKAGRKAGVPTAAVCWGFNSAEALSAAEPAWLLPDASQMTHLIRQITPE